ncbi:uncharacterized protein LOC122392808 [Amphibalanus amphitrite]|nr:uncharacterized protein LOC122392808 [Amphibalanus amphitrite]
MEWARDCEGRESDLDYLLQCLKNEISRKERSQVLEGNSVSVQSGAQTRITPGRRGNRSAAGAVPSAAALQATTAAAGAVPSAAALQATTAPVDRCGFCQKPHHVSAKCRGFLKLGVGKRLMRVKQSGLCFQCFSAGHRARDCSVRCECCGGRHHVLCCYKQQGQTQGDQGSTESHRQMSNSADVGAVSRGVSDVSLSCNTVQKKDCIVLPTARVTVIGSRGPVEATVLFDSGSDRTYVSESLVQRASPKWTGSEDTSYVAFGGKKSCVSQQNTYDVTMQSACGEKVSVKAVSVPVICQPLQRPRVTQDVLQQLGLAGIEMADVYQSDREVSIDILIGLDVYWSLVKPGIVRAVDGLVAQMTVFGWVISGAVAGSGGSLSGVGCQLLTLGDVHSTSLRNLWSLEGVGIAKDDDAMPDVLAEFESSVHMREGRYEVKLPWKPGAVGKLQDNLASAKARLASLTRKLSKDPGLCDRYNSALRDMEEAGVIAEVPAEEMCTSKPTFYLPHRPVVKESSSSTKVRPVFDASSCGPNGVSLNDCLEIGPCLLPDLVEVLLRFRRWPVAVTGDITKAFLQISLCKEDQDTHRFLWERDGVVRVMRAQRVIFGVCSSPFLLNATIRHHLSHYPDSAVITEMRENFYVDDLLSGADTEQEAAELLSKAQEVMSDAGMTLTKCRTNSPVLFEKAQTVMGTGLNESCKVLGVMWQPTDDVFTFQGVTLPDDIVPTKRVVLSFVARMFDPLGFVGPFVMTLKCLFQELWQLGLHWDEPLPEIFSETFSRWLRELELLKEFQVPRRYFETAWKGTQRVELLAFCDASPKGGSPAQQVNLSQLRSRSQRRHGYWVRRLF